MRKNRKHNELTFSLPAIMRLVKLTMDNPDQWRQPYTEDRPSTPGLQLIGDQGVYLMAGVDFDVQPKRDGDPEQADVLYAEECNPHTQEFDEWWDVKQDTFGGDDACEWLELSDPIRSVLKEHHDAGFRWLVVEFDRAGFHCFVES